MTKQRWAMVLLAALATGACNSNGSRTQDADSGQPEAAPAAPAQPAGVDQPAEDVPPATMQDIQGDPKAEANEGADHQARFDGYGELVLGMPAQQLPKAWGGELKRLGRAEDSCYYMTPKWVKAADELAFMVEDGRFVRYGTSKATMLAPGGGKVGMTLGALRDVYGARMQDSPHKYVKGAHNLRIAEGNGKSALVFETDAKGKVTRWRVGQAPQVDYVEGCS